MISVILVEDHDGLREDTVFGLNAEGLQAQGVADSAAFYRLYALGAPDVVVIDRMLAGEDGMARRLLIAVAKGLPANLRQNKEYAARRRACVVRIGFGSDGARVMAMVCGSSYAGLNRFKFAGLALCRLSLLQQTPRSE